jgi:hypothetical protein
MNQMGSTLPAGTTSTPKLNFFTNTLPQPQTSTSLSPLSWQPLNTAAPGSLHIKDSFVPSSPEDSSHGQLVRRAALGDGFQGNVVESQTISTSESSYAESVLASELRSPEKTKEFLKFMVNNEVGEFFNNQSGYLETLSRAGVKNSSVNLSLGVSKASVSSRLYSNAFNALKSQKPGQARMAENMIRNQAGAFDLDAGKLLSKDPKVHGPERQKLQQHLVNFTSEEFEQSPVIAASRKRYDQAVSKIENGRNSVVISAGNWGEYESQLEQDNHGLPIDTPEDFTQNILENDEVTSVGATRWAIEGGQLKEKKAEYTSSSKGVDIYASGSLGLKDPNVCDTMGTSFASPRVAAALAEIHRLNPEFSSSQAESLLKEQLTHQLPQQGGDLKVLDYVKNFTFLKTRTF